MDLNKIFLTYLDGHTALVISKRANKSIVLPLHNEVNLISMAKVIITSANAVD